VTAPPRPADAGAGTAPDEALALRDVVKRFGPAVALDGASLTVPTRTLHAVLGENGAGKTTLMRAAFGLVRPDGGEVRVLGRARRFATPAEAIAAGVGMVHQHFTLVPAMTVAENVALGGRGRFDPAAAAARVRAVGEATGLRLDPAAVVGTLPVAAQQRLEIVKALARAARVLILDEPAAVLGPDEAEELLGWLRRWVDGGGTAVLVTHKLRDALRHADAVTVLRRGRTVLARPVGRGADALTESQLAAAMLGEAAASGSAAAGVPEAAGTPRPAPTAPSPTAPPAGAPSAGAAVVRAERVGAVDDRGVVRLREATFVVRAGELVGVAAVEGSGQHELLRLLAGRLAPAAGTLERPARVAFVPEDRHRDALLVAAPLVENLALAGAGARRGRVPWGALAARVAALADGFDVRGGSAATPAGALSGGNQQKFVVARELAGDADGDVPALVVAENPTRGLDIARRPRCGPGCSRRGTQGRRWSSTRATWTRCSRWPTACWWCTTAGCAPRPPSARSSDGSCSAPGGRGRRPAPGGPREPAFRAPGAAPGARADPQPYTFPGPVVPFAFRCRRSAVAFRLPPRFRPLRRARPGCGRALRSPDGSRRGRWSPRCWPRASTARAWPPTTGCSSRRAFARRTRSPRSPRRTTPDSWPSATTNACGWGSGARSGSPSRRRRTCDFPGRSGAGSRGGSSPARRGATRTSSTPTRSPTTRRRCPAW
jgi:simple sugar transport system ATP-binding protein